jgi:hypothetical protein
VSVALSLGWEQRVVRKGATPSDVIDCVLEYVSEFQESVTARDGSPEGAILGVLFLNDSTRSRLGLTDGELFIELAGALFRVSVAQVAEEEAMRLRAQSDQDTAEERERERMRTGR